MPFKRRISKQTDMPITPRMIELFDAWRRASGERRDELHGDLWDAYMTALMPHPRPWQWPCVRPPGPAPDYDRPAQELYEALAEASREARQARRFRANGAPHQPPPPPAS